MSLEPRNIVCDGPDVMSKALAIGVFPLNSNGDGSPIYTTLDVVVSVSGSYSDGDLNYEFSGTTDIPQRNRISLRSVVGGVDIAGENYEIERDHDVSSWVNFGVIGGAGGEAEFVAVQANALGCNGGIPPFAPPQFYPGFLIGYAEGTRTDTAEDPDAIEERAIELSVATPSFTGSIQDGNLKMRVSLSIIVNFGSPDAYEETFLHDIDASAWGTAEFRDIRGTYGTISTDANGIVYTWEITIG